MIEDILILAPTSACRKETVLQGNNESKYIFLWRERQRAMILFWRGMGKSEEVFAFFAFRHVILELVLWKPSRAKRGRNSTYLSVQPLCSTGNDCEPILLFEV
jgi:hypothetical protein